MEKDQTNYKALEIKIVSLYKGIIVLSFMFNKNSLGIIDKSEGFKSLKISDEEWIELIKLIGKHVSNETLYSHFAKLV